LGKLTGAGYPIKNGVYTVINIVARPVKEFITMVTATAVFISSINAFPISPTWIISTIININTATVYKNKTYVTIATVFANAINAVSVWLAWIVFALVYV